MKTSLILFTAATLAPTLVLVGIGTTAAFSIASIVGVAAMIGQDYGPKTSYRLETAKVRVARTEHHPFAA